VISERGRSRRIFEQGELWLDAPQASLRLGAGAAPRELLLDVNEVSSIPDELVSQVQHSRQKLDT